MTVIRSERSNFICCVCLDLETGDWVIVENLDMRKPLDRYIPEWIVEEVVNSNIG